MSDRYNHRSSPRGGGRHRSRSRSRSRSPRDRRRSRSRSFESRSRSRHGHDARRSPLRRRSLSPPPPPQRPRPRPRPRGFTPSPFYRETRRQELYVFKYVALDQYKADYMASKYAHLTFDAKMRLFNSRTMPIFVPLAPSETRDQYETRFYEWLRRCHQLTLAQVQHTSDIYKERELRIEFANRNVTRLERFETFDWSKVCEETAPSQEATNEEEDATLKTTEAATRGQEQSTKSPDKGTVTQDIGSLPPSVCPHKHPEWLTGTLSEAYLACGCTPCLFAVMDTMAQQLDAIQSASVSTAVSRGTATTTEQQRVVDLTRDDDAQSPTRPRSHEKTSNNSKETSVS